MIRIIHQREKCIGCNACREVSTHRWRISRKDGKSVLVESIAKNGYYNVVTGDDEYEESKVIEKNCPVKIIKVRRL